MENQTVPQVQQSPPDRKRRPIFQVIPQETSLKTTLTKAFEKLVEKQSQAAERQSIKTILQKSLSDRLSENKRVLKEWDQKRIQALNRNKYVLQRLMSRADSFLNDINQQVQTVKTFFQRVISQMQNLLLVKLPNIQFKHAELTMFAAVEESCRKRQEMLSNMNFSLKKQILQQIIQQFIIEKEALIFRIKTKISADFSRLEETAEKLNKLAQKMNKTDDPIDLTRQLIQASRLQSTQHKQLAKHVFQYAGIMVSVNGMMFESFNQASSKFSQLSQSCLQERIQVDKKVLKKTFQQVYLAKSEGEQFSSKQQLEAFLFAVQVQSPPNHFLIIKNYPGFLVLGEPQDQSIALQVTVGNLIRIIRKDKEPIKFKIGQSKLGVSQTGILTIQRKKGLLGLVRDKEVISLRLEDEERLEQLLDICQNLGSVGK